MNMRSGHLLFIGHRYGSKHVCYADGQDVVPWRLLMGIHSSLITPKFDEHFIHMDYMLVFFSEIPMCATSLIFLAYFSN